MDEKGLLAKMRQGLHDAAAGIEQTPANSADFQKAIAQEIERVSQMTIAELFDLYGEPEYWAIPTDAGDCEDYLLLKKRYLEGLGFPAAAVQMWATIMGADTTQYVAVSVVEPTVPTAVDHSTSSSATSTLRLMASFSPAGQGAMYSCAPNPPTAAGAPRAGWTGPSAARRWCASAGWWSRGWPRCG